MCGGTKDGRREGVREGGKEGRTFHPRQMADRLGCLVDDHLVLVPQAALQKLRPAFGSGAWKEGGREGGREEKE